LFAPFANLIGKLFGGAAEEIGAMLRDQVTNRRKIRQIRLFKKLSAAIEDSGIHPRQIPDNIWIPALEAASVEDDESIQELWVNLLANAADLETGERIHKVHVSILRELTSEGARFLDALFGNGKIDLFTQGQLIVMAAERGLIRADGYELPKLSQIISMLRRQGLLELAPTPVADHTETTNEEGEQNLQLRGINLVPRYELTPLAVAFLEACRAPGMRGRRMA